MSSITLVSAIYSDNVNSYYGGRGRGLAEYYPSLVNISRLGLNLVLYCDPSQVDAIKETVGPLFKQGLTVVGYELKQFKYYEFWQNWKQMRPELGDRNEILCFSKLFWLQQTIQNCHSSFYLWIDAGLTHHGIFPEKFGGVELRITYPPGKFHPLNKENIFNPTLTQRILTELNSQPEKLWFLATSMHGMNHYLQEITSNVMKQTCPLIREHLVGGLFGGTAVAIQMLLDKFEPLLETVLALNTFYCFEEHLFSAINATYPSYFKLKTFESFWFHLPGEITSYLEKDVNSFYKLFLP